MWAVPLLRFDQVTKVARAPSRATFSHALLSAHPSQALDALAGEAPVMSVQSAAAAIASGQIGPVHYPDCYIGQRFGIGFVSFDECISAAGSFKCDLQSGGDSCNPDVCGGGHSHSGCSCEGCTLEPVADAAEAANPPIDYKCTCDTNCHCDGIVAAAAAGESVEVVRKSSS